MLRRNLTLLLLAGTLWLARPVEGAGGELPLQVVPSVDLARYAGKWYEIARLPNRFQRDCAANTSAAYTLRPDGKITVVNECRKADGRLKSAKGTARVADPKGPNTKLKVTFFWPFSGKYWIIDIDPQYRWVVIGEPGRDYLWILSREPRMEDAIYNQIIERVKQQGYEVGRLMKTAQP